MNNDILNKAIEIKEYAKSIRRKIHQSPELGLHEFKTTALIKKELQEMNINTLALSTECGVVGIIKGEKEGPNIVTALRADIDALPIQEKTGLEYASNEKGIMHACGHDGHAAVLLGTAKLLNTMKERFSGTVKLIFQPAEETMKGAKIMVEEGVLKNPEVDQIVALHCWPLLDVGKVGIWPGPYMASADTFTISVKGKGGHGAYPHRSKDAVLAAAQVIIALQSIVSREIDAFDNVVISVCTVHGGTVFNVIPEEVVLSGTVRCQGLDARNTIRGRIDRIVRGITVSYDCCYELNYEYGVPALINNPEVIENVAKAADQALGKGNVVQLPSPAMSSEDFSIYLEKIPAGAFIRLGINTPGEDCVILHNERFDFNDEAIPTGIALLTQFVLNSNNSSDTK